MNQALALSLGANNGAAEAQSQELLTLMERQRGCSAPKIGESSRSAAEAQSQELLEAGVIAAYGLQGDPQTLPYAQRIQRSFGHHDLSGVQAHLGEHAKEATLRLGAKAYATGNSVAFGQAPDLHTTAHEAAHVIQQRGGVRLKGGVGRVGDQYEQHADAVADAVVAERSAEALLDQQSGEVNPSKNAPPVQLKKSPVQRSKKRKPTAKPLGAIDQKLEAAMNGLEIHDALEDQLRVEAPLIQKVINATAAPKLALALKSTFEPLLTDLNEKGRKAEAMEILSRITLHLRQLQVPKAKLFQGNFKKKQLLINKLPQLPREIISSKNADLLAKLSQIGGGEYQAAVHARYQAVTKLRRAYYIGAAPREQIRQYLLHSSDDDEIKTRTLGKIAALNMRGDFLLGRMNEGGGEKPQISPEELKRQSLSANELRLGTHPKGWEHDLEGNLTENQGVAVDPLVEPMGATKDYPGAWCLKAAGLQHARAGVLPYNKNDDLFGNSKSRMSYMSNLKLFDISKDGSRGKKKIMNKSKTMAHSGGGAAYVGSYRLKESIWLKIRDFATEFSSKANILGAESKIKNDMNKQLLHPLTDPKAIENIIGTSNINEDRDLILSRIYHPLDKRKHVQLQKSLDRYIEIIDQLPKERLPPQAGDILSLGAERHYNKGRRRHEGGKSHHAGMVEDFDRQAQIIYTIEANQNDQMTGRTIELCKPETYAKKERALNIFALSRHGVPQYEENPEFKQALKAQQKAVKPAPQRAGLLKGIKLLNAALGALAAQWNWVHSGGGELVFSLYTGLKKPVYLGGDVQ